MLMEYGCPAIDGATVIFLTNGQPIFRGPARSGIGVGKSCRLVRQKAPVGPALAGIFLAGIERFPLVWTLLYQPT